MGNPYKVVHCLRANQWSLPLTSCSRIMLAALGMPFWAVQCKGNFVSIISTGRDGVWIANTDTQSQSRPNDNRGQDRVQHASEYISGVACYSSTGYDRGPRTEELFHRHLPYSSQLRREQTFPWTIHLSFHITYLSALCLEEKIAV